MKQDSCMGMSASIERESPDADSPGLLRSGHGKESKSQGIKAVHGQNTHIQLLPNKTNNSKGSKGISWSKTIEVAYLNEPAVWSTYSLHHYFATRPRQQTQDNDHEPVDQHQKETDSEECQGNQAEGSHRC